MLNETLTFLLKHPVKLCIFTGEAKGLGKAEGFLTKLHAPKKEITGVQRCTIHAQRKEKERCDVRGTFYDAETKFKGQMVWPNATNEKVFLQTDGKKKKKTTKKVKCKNKRIRGL